MTINQLRTRLLQLEKARLDKVPVDAAKELNRLNSNIVSYIDDFLLKTNN